MCVCASVSHIVRIQSRQNICVKQIYRRVCVRSHPTTTKKHLFPPSVVSSSSLRKKTRDETRRERERERETRARARIKNTHTHKTAVFLTSLSLSSSREYSYYSYSYCDDINVNNSANVLEKMARRERRKA